MIKIRARAEQLGKELCAKNKKLATAESCTGGGLAYWLTEIPGSSEWFERGWVTYSNDSKQELLNVSEDLLTESGAVSKEVVEAMAQGALLNSHADLALAISGVAGPLGGTEDKPVGTVWFALGNNETIHASLKKFSGNRYEIRQHAIEFALELLLSDIKIR
jgi:nicotinamide-nucleotide amidase